MAPYHTIRTTREVVNFTFNQRWNTSRSEVDMIDFIACEIWMYEQQQKTELGCESVAFNGMVSVELKSTNSSLRVPWCARLQPQGKQAVVHSTAFKEKLGLFGGRSLFQSFPAVSYGHHHTGGRLGHRIPLEQRLFSHATRDTCCWAPPYGSASPLDFGVGRRPSALVLIPNTKYRPISPS